MGSNSMKAERISDMITQYGNYVVEQLTGHAEGVIVRVVGATEPISNHPNRIDARNAVKRYQAADKMRAKRNN